MRADATRKGFGRDAAERYVSQVRWTFASTMPGWPHEYTVKAWRPDQVEEFEAMCDLIRTTGVVEPWPPAPQQPIYHNHYLVVGEYKYWPMGSDGDRGPLSALTVINRTVAIGQSDASSTITAEGAVARPARSPSSEEWGSCHGD